MVKSIRIVAAFFFCGLVVFDVTNLVPTFNQSAYYLFAVPSQSTKEMLFWASMLSAGLTCLIRFQSGWRVYITIFLDSVSVILLGFFLYELIYAFVFISSGESPSPAEDSTSIFSQTMGRAVALLLGSILLIVVLFVSWVKKFTES